jgi:hypothetical protein
VTQEMDRRWNYRHEKDRMERKDSVASCENCENRRFLSDEERDGWAVHGRNGERVQFLMAAVVAMSKYCWKEFYPVVV